jgi:hypothetical protein
MRAARRERVGDGFDGRRVLPAPPEERSAAAPSTGAPLAVSKTGAA